MIILDIQTLDQYRYSQYEMYQTIKLSTLIDNCLYGTFIPTLAQLTAKKHVDDKLLKRLPLIGGK